MSWTYMEIHGGHVPPCQALQDTCPNTPNAGFETWDPSTPPHLRVQGGVWVGSQSPVVRCTSLGQFKTRSIPVSLHGLQPITYIGPESSGLNISMYSIYGASGWGTTLIPGGSFWCCAVQHGGSSFTCSLSSQAQTANSFLHTCSNYFKLKSLTLINLSST